MAYRALEHCMKTDLALHIEQTPICNTHEHLRKEKEFKQSGPDILQALFENYVPADLSVAGASQENLNQLLDRSNPDIRARFEGIRDAWECIRHTGYGEAVRIIAQRLYDIEEITPEALEAAQERHQELLGPGMRLKILREMANIDHVQVDDFCWPCSPDPSGPDFFFYDISWAGFSSGTPGIEELVKETGVDVRNLATLKQAMGGLFEKYAKYAIAIKSQHAYNRTLRWRKRSDAEAERALAAYLHQRDSVTEEERLCLGDWCWARGVELGIEHDLPFKMHTGYYAGHSSMVMERISCGHLSPLLLAYPKARFVLMHISYPYNDELVGLAKQFRNVYPDLCWGWSIDPYSACDFVRRCLHAVPANKLFVFGGDTGWPMGSLGYAYQTRSWLNRALQGEVDDGLMTESQAMRVASRLMRENQYACFRVEDKKAACLAG